MDEVLWDELEGRWRDAWLEEDDDSEGSEEDSEDSEGSDGSDSDSEDGNSGFCCSASSGGEGLWKKREGKAVERERKLEAKVFRVLPHHRPVQQHHEQHHEQQHQQQQQQHLPDRRRRFSRRDPVSHLDGSKAVLSDFVPLWAGLADGDARKQTRALRSLAQSGLVVTKTSRKAASCSGGTSQAAATTTAAAAAVVVGPCSDEEDKEEEVVEGNEEGGLVLGLATTTEFHWANSAEGQQWEWPNAWPPLVEMLVEGLERCVLADRIAWPPPPRPLRSHAGSQTKFPAPLSNQTAGTAAAATSPFSAETSTCEASTRTQGRAARRRGACMMKSGPEFALLLAQGWVTAAHNAFVRSGGYMYEKYDATSVCGSGGSGGEYVPQVGFGWSNGAALRFLEKYGAHLSASTTTTCLQALPQAQTKKVAVAMVGAAVAEKLAMAEAATAAEEAEAATAEAAAARC